MIYNIDNIKAIRTIADLRQTGYMPKSIKQELRDNLIIKLQNKENPFPGIWGYEDTIVPELERAILSMHNISLLGLRGQAKTRLARMMVNLLDEYIPVLEGSELNDDPFEPLSRYAIDKIAEYGEAAPISWMHRSERYTEKLATPDVSVADLIGDADPIKAATLKLPYSDERVIHYGLIPRSHRCIFVINELPDLQARIQVALFNILQEGDIQIRGFKIRLPLDIQFVFTANPEDYTNRGSIVTPLKDRIESQIVTHYPRTIDVGRKITAQEARIKPEQAHKIELNELIQDMIEQIAFEARDNEYVDAKSGVSARLTISAFENLLSTAERRAIINGEDKTHIRIADLWGVIPSVTGKVELVYEGEQEGPLIVAQNLIGKAIRTYFTQFFPEPEKAKKLKNKNPYLKITTWFGEGKHVELLNDATNKAYADALEQVDGLRELVQTLHPKLDDATQLFLMEFTLHGLSEYSAISKNRLIRGVEFKDLLSSMFSMNDIQPDDDE